MKNNNRNCMWDAGKKYTRIKLCEFESLDPAYEACSLGVDALGFHIFRSQDYEEKAARFAVFFRYLPKTTNRVLLTDLDADILIRILVGLKVDVIQLYPDWDATYIKEFRKKIDSDVKILKVMSAQLDENVIRDYSKFLHHYTDVVDGILLDSFRIGGTGRTADWDLCAKIVADSSVPVFLAGGLDASNIGEAIRRVRPFGVDVENGVSDRIPDGPLVKNMAKCRAFVEAVRMADSLLADV